MLVLEPIQDGFVAVTNAVSDSTIPLKDRVSPSDSFTDPGLPQWVTPKRRPAKHTRRDSSHTVRSTTRTIIDRRKVGFWKLIADRKSTKILGCHVVGERAVDIVQVAAITIDAGMRVDGWPVFPSRFPPTRSPR